MRKVLVELLPWEKFLEDAHLYF